MADQDAETYVGLSAFILATWGATSLHEPLCPAKRGEEQISLSLAR